MSENLEEFLEQISSAMPAEADRKTLEQAIKHWRATREKRLELQRLTDAMQKIETGLKSWVIEVFRQQVHEGVIIGGRVTALTDKEQATVSNKEEFLDHIRETGELELLQFRLATGAVDERMKEGIKVPGTEYIKVYDLSDKKG